MKIVLRRETDADRHNRLKEELLERLRQMILNCTIASNFKTSIYDEIAFSLDHPSQIFDRVFVNFNIAKALMEVFADCGFEHMTNFGGYNDIVVFWNNFASVGFQYQKFEEPLSIIPNSKVIVFVGKEKNFTEFKVYYGLKTKETINTFHIGKKSVIATPRERESSTPRLLTKVLSLSKFFDFSTK